MYDFHKPTCCCCHCMFFISFCPFRLTSKQYPIFNCSLSLIFLASQLNILLAQCARLANEIAALLLECSAVPALVAAVIMLSLPVLSAVNCLFCLCRLLFCAAVMFFLLFPSFFPSLCVVNLCLPARSLPEITRE